jgi:hypothetical protein
MRTDVHVPQQNCLFLRDSARYKTGIPGFAGHEGMPAAVYTYSTLDPTANELESRQKVPGANGIVVRAR